MSLTARTRLAVPAVVAAAITSVAGVLPASTPGAAPAAEAATPTQHIVKPGQTLSGIGRLYGMSYATLASYNGIGPPYTIYPDGLLRLTRPTAPLPGFSSSVSAVTATQLGVSYRSGCPVGPASLRLVQVTHLGFDGVARTGQLVVHSDVVSRTVAVFRQLYAQRFPVQRIVPVTAYGGSDAASMDANNTSAFNCRFKTGSTTSYSEHSYGRAVDVNPVQNPYVKGTTVLPSAGAAFTDRSRYQRGMVHSGGAVSPFLAQGFHWGGDWSTLKDYQHFSTTNR